MHKTFQGAGLVMNKKKKVFYLFILFKIQHCIALSTIMLIIIKCLDSKYRAKYQLARLNLIQFLN